MSEGLAASNGKQYSFFPWTVLAVAVPFHLMGLSFNVMSLGGIAIATGALVDAAIVVVEQTHEKLEEWPTEGRTGRCG